ncbi:NADH-quinone oxidoreductase subunit G [Nakamurella leprariae]|uniref:NADH-quinone oxidoreductase n=1 Tax=Nakamurella leprariae TaxID=2803911 RepID=A0A938Y5N9_9ACTN|nr:NADH-quinone oxidoreductase subunit G [Nakamurella leprariae]MBM9466245.1 NADH-quinone oxidoreductase subunit G [Nakamurella leprariae]
MTQVATPPAGTPEQEPPGPPPGHVRLTIDGVQVDAPKGELVIRAAERIGTAIPRFCDHPLLDPVGACRQCLVEVEMGGRKMPKPQAACTQTVADGMVVNTQLSSPVAEQAQRSNLEFLLLNHPLDCPICDKGGECPLQNQTLANGPSASRLRDPKRVFTKPIPVSTQILLDRERCVLCQRCTRFSAQIAGDRFIDLLERGSAQQIGINRTEPFQSYFSGNTIQICPVGALTSAAYRFRARPFDLVSTPTTCEHCASGCSLRTDSRAGGITRRLAADDPQVNEEWNCDKGRFAFTYLRQGDRLTQPLVRNADGMLRPASWTDAMAAAARGLLQARDAGGVGVLPGGRVSVTDAYAYAKFARVALRSNDIDFRVRDTPVLDNGAEEAGFLARRVVGRGPGRGGVTHQELEHAPAVLLVGFEPEDESPIVFLRLRKAVRSRGLAVFAVGALATRGLEKLDGTLLPATPGTEPAVLAGLTREGTADTGLGEAAAAARNRLGAALRSAGAVLLVGERAAAVPGLLTAVETLADATGARIGWVPRRAGDRGALEVGAFPTLLPGGRPVTDAAARAEVEAAWGVPVPETPGRDTGGILAAVRDGDLSGLVIGGVDPADLPDPGAALTAVTAASFVVSLEIRASAVTELADVVLPVAAAPEKPGAFMNWEGRMRPFAAVLPEVGRLDEGRVLDTLGVEMDVDLYTQTPAAAAGELGRLGGWPAERTAAAIDPAGPVRSGPPESHGLTPHDKVLTSWRPLLDGGRMTDGEPALAGTARPEVVRLSAASAQALGVVDGAPVTVRGPGGGLTLPVAVTEPMRTDAVWLPARVGGRPLSAWIGTSAGHAVRVMAGAGIGREAR